jgi:hypothetical protein
MNELIWFSIPGAVGLYALHLAFPDSNWDNKVLVIASAPVLGFILHQFYRTIFEARRGWETDSRPVLALIRGVYKIDNSDKQMPFLIWETTFYSKAVPDSFRNHNRNSWHYVMSFRSVAFASAVSGVVLACVPAFWQTSNLPVAQLALFAGLFVLFWQKSRLTYSSVTKQECAAFRRHREGFDDTHGAMTT